MPSDSALSGEMSLTSSLAVGLTTRDNG